VVFLGQIYKLCFQKGGKKEKYVLFWFGLVFTSTGLEKESDLLTLSFVCHRKKIACDGYTVDKFLSY